MRLWCEWKKPKPIRINNRSVSMTLIIIFHHSISCYLNILSKMCILLNCAEEEEKPLQNPFAARKRCLNSFCVTDFCPKKIPEKNANLQPLASCCRQSQNCPQFILMHWNDRPNNNKRKTTWSSSKTNLLFFLGCVCERGRVFKWNGIDLSRSNN